MRSPTTKTLVITGSVAAVLAVASCKSAASHMADVMMELIKNCYEADGITFEGHTDSGISVKLPSGEIRHVDKNKMDFTGLKKKEKPKGTGKEGQDVPSPVAPPLRPVIAVAVDPSYTGSDGFALSSLGLSSGGNPITIGGDDVALGALRAQAGNLNWQLMAAKTTIDPALGTSVDVSFDITFEMTTKLTPGSQSAPAIPVVYAVRLAEGSPFEILRDVAEHEHGAFATVEPLVDSADLVGGALQVARGQQLQLTSLDLWNNRASNFRGSVDLSIQRATGNSGVLRSLAVSSLRGFTQTTFGAVTVPTQGLLQGRHELVMRVVENGAVIAAIRVPLDVTGPQYQLPLLRFNGEISAAAGGGTTMWIDGDAADAGASYLMLTSVTPGLGSSVNGIDFPIIFDAQTSAGLGWIGTFMLPNGAGVLDAQGFASVDFVLPPIPGTQGIELFFAPYLDHTAAGGGLGSSTNAACLRILP